jgi:hypothetical protein
MSALFGECAVLDDGRRVIAPFNTPGLYIGNVYLPGDQFRFPDAVLTAGGSVWVSAKNQNGPNVSVILWKGGVSKVYVLPVIGFGSRTVIRSEGESCRVGCTTSATTWRCFQVDPNGTITAIEQGVIADGSGGRGMRDWLHGSPRPLTPLNQILSGHPVRSIVGSEHVSIACGLPPLPPQTVCQIGGTLGTLLEAEIDQLSPRVSANGQHWCGVWYDPPAIHGGAMPAAVPPLVEGPPEIIPLSNPVSTAWFFDNGKYGTDPAAPCDWSIIVNTGCVPNKPVIIARTSDEGVDLIKEYRTRWDKVAGIYVTSEKGDLKTEARLAIARQTDLNLPVKPLYSYTGRTVQAALDVPAITYCGVECYLLAGESPSDAEHRWRNQIQFVLGAHRQCWLVCQAYTAPTEILQVLMGRYPEVARAINRPLVLAWFAWLRPGGGKEHNLGPYAQATKDATTPMLVPSGADVTPKATITSYETPIALAATSRAVAQVTQGTPDRFRWQYFDGSSWVTAADNPALDLDHHYKFPRAGSFNIRLQTMKAGIVTDTSNSTSRTVVVLAAPEPPNPNPQPPTPGPGQVVAHVTDTKTGAAIRDAATWSQLTPGTIVKTDANGYALITASASGVCTKKDGYHSPGLPNQQETCRVLAPLIELQLQPIPPPAPPVPVIHAAGKIFRTATNEAWRYKGVSAFKLCRLWDDGQDIQPFLEAYAGFNTLRVWAYTDWAGTGWEPSTAAVTREFFRYCMSKEFLVEYTLLTNDSLDRSNWAQEFVAKLAEDPQSPIFIEGRNEPQTHSQTVSTARLKPALEASQFVYASGNYEISANAFGPYLVAHTQRDSEWPRRCHDLMEYYNGGGPHKPSDPAHKVPCLADEPPKTQDVAPPKPPLTKADDWRAYFGGCALLGGGATFHSETGKWGQVPTGDERTLAAAALEGLNAFPADAPLGAYSRPNDSSLRTYIVGNYMVRIRPITPNPPLSGWSRIGTSNILWKR